jgi:hypothetical protein
MGVVRRGLAVALLALPRSIFWEPCWPRLGSRYSATGWW